MRIAPLITVAMSADDGPAERRRPVLATHATGGQSPHAVLRSLCRCLTLLAVVCMLGLLATPRASACTHHVLSTPALHHADQVDRRIASIHLAEHPAVPVPPCDHAGSCCPGTACSPGWFPAADPAPGAIATFAKVRYADLASLDRVGTKALPSLPPPRRFC